MGDIKPGDVVYDETGKPCNVINVSGVMTDRPCYKVRFSDGTEVIADENHEWFTWSKAARKSYGRRSGKVRKAETLPSVKTTKEISESVFVSRKDDKTEFNHSIPLALPIEGCEQSLLIAPYILGAWLGDGDSNGAGLTNPDFEVIQAIGGEGYRIDPIAKEYGWYIYGDTTRPRQRGVSDRAKTLHNCFQADLRQLGLLKNKHIPSCYLRASIADRMALLQGLMDTDGSAEKTGRCSFEVTNESLANGAFELIASLGFQPKMHIKDAVLDGRVIGDVYRIRFHPKIPVFRLPRKLERQKLGKTPKHREHRFIVSVEPIESVPVQCIEVDSPNHLFLVTKSFISTHNSRLSLTTGLMAAMGQLPNYTQMLAEPAENTIDMVQLPGGVWVPKDEPKLAFPYDPASPPTVVFAMPTLKQCKKIFWKPLVNLLAGQPFVENINRAEHTIKLVGDLPEIVCVGLNDGDGDRVRGFRIAALLADEWQDVKPMIWDEVLQPAMADTPGSIALFTGTPKGKVNHLYKFDLKSQEFDDWGSFRFETADNPFVPREEIARAEATQDPRTFRQEFKASYEDFPGQIFDHLKDSHLVANIPTAFKRIVMGVDWGDVNPALCVAGKDNNGKWWVLDTWYSSSGVNVLDDVFLAEGKRLKEKYGVQAVWCGHDRPASIQKWRTELKIPCKSWQDAKKGKGKAPGLNERNNRVNALIYHNQLAIAAHLSDFRDKMGSYHRDTDSMGNILDTVAKGQDDHEVDACTMAIGSEEFSHVASFSKSKARYR
ncbi:MAG: hypothetical protein AAGA46_00475 [Cyanobacteria bacterium P01_F01_bin.13]